MNAKNINVARGTTQYSITEDNETTVLHNYNFMQNQYCFELPTQKFTWRNKNQEICGLYNPR